MPWLRRCSLGWLLLAFASGAFAGERAVEINPELKGAYVTPEGVWDGRAVLLLHGFASDMDDAGGLLKRLADELASQGIASLRINFRGEGDAKRTAIESTLATRIADTEAAYGFLLKDKRVAPQKIGVTGWSLGAATAIETAARHPGWFKTVVLWSSPSGDLFAWWQGSETAQRALREGVATEEVPGWKAITTKREFYESFRGVNLDRSIAKVSASLLTIRGTGDFLPQRDPELVKAAGGKPAEAALLGGAGHTFNVFEPGSSHPGRVLALTVGWLKQRL